MKDILELLKSKQSTLIVHATIAQTKQAFRNQMTDNLPLEMQFNPARLKITLDDTYVRFVPAYQDPEWFKGAKAVVELVKPYTFPTWRQQNLWQIFQKLQERHRVSTNA